MRTCVYIFTHKTFFGIWSSCPFMTQTAPVSFLEGYAPPRVQVNLEKARDGKDDVKIFINNYKQKVPTVIKDYLTNHFTKSHFTNPKLP